MAEKPEAVVAQLAPGALALIEQVSLRYDALVPQGITVEDLLNPAFWAHHASKLQPWNEIRVRAEDGTWLAECLVLDCSRNWAKVTILQHYRLTTPDVALTQAEGENQVAAFIAAHKVVHRGPHKWSVVREADKAVLVDGIAVKDDAIAWLERHAREQLGVRAPAKAEPQAAVT